jgi:hypothetical protein
MLRSHSILCDGPRADQAQVRKTIMTISWTNQIQLRRTLAKDARLSK